LKNLLLAALSWTAALAPMGASAAQPSQPLLDAMFQDHAVLQRDRPIPVWGHAQPGEPVTVSIDGHSVRASADAAGFWRSALPALPAGGPYSLSVRAQSGAGQSVSDVLVGDVWLCSGQSNMELPVSGSLNAAREITASANDSIRLLTVAHATSATPQRHFAEPVAWLAAEPATIRDFSAACYYFARELQKSVKVPFGLIHSSWGGSAIESWLSESELRLLGGFDERLDLLHLYARDGGWRVHRRARRPGSRQTATPRIGPRFRSPCATGKPGVFPNSRITTAWFGFDAR
jgi:sialate O-acetylesterase